MIDRHACSVACRRPTNDSYLTIVYILYTTTLSISCVYTARSATLTSVYCTSLCLDGSLNLRYYGISRKADTLLPDVI